MPTNQHKSLISTYVILPVHNRKATTLKCLAHLKEQSDLSAYHIIVVDDGSTDGTAQAVLDQYPAVTLLKGNGSLWWTGAIKLGMEHALSKGADYCVWLNDDTFPESGAIQALIDYCDERPKTIAAANILDPDTYEPSYGGVIRRKFKILPIFSKKQQPILCDGLSGNLVCINSNCIRTIGYPNDALYPHYYGDVIYTHRAQLTGYKLVLLNNAIAHCKDDHKSILWFHCDRPLIEILGERLEIKSPHYWKAHLAYYRSFLGVTGIVLYIYEIWLKMLFLVTVRKLLKFAIKSC
jgi:GT2 family glycosyltransferase